MNKYRTYTIDRLHFRGDGLAIDHEDGAHRHIHIANALPGETVTAVEPEPVENQENPYIRRRFASIVDVIHPAKERCKPPCTWWRQCPACQFQCMDYQAQVKHKFDNWCKLIGRFVALPEKIGFMPANAQLHYRQKTETLVFGCTLGIASRPGMQNRPVPLRECVLHTALLNDLIAQVEKILPALMFPDETRLEFEASPWTDGSENRRITVYAAPQKVEVCREAAHKMAERLGISVIFQELPPKGSHVYPKPELFGETQWFAYDCDNAGHVLYAMKGAWTPVNPENAHLIRESLCRMVSPYTFESVLELGCGCGTHTSVFGEKAQTYTGIDISWPAIQSAQYNAQCHGWQNVNFYTDSADHYLDKRYFCGRRADAILMHSNRLPYSKEVAQMCRRFGAKHIFVVAPTAYAMAQECKHFDELGYHPEELMICDTLPMTYHQMAVAHLILAAKP